MNILIIEDENLAADKLESMLTDIDPSLKILAKLGSIEMSVQWLSQHKADLIFLDIHLSDGISFSIFEKIHVNAPIVFTTAFDNYAIRAFQLNSISYLLKPIRKSDLGECLKKYHTLKSTFSIDFEMLLSNIQNKEPYYKKRFLIQAGEKIKAIDVSDIAYFHALDQGVYIKTFNDNMYPIDLTLDKVIKLLNPDNFFRINRKYIVNINAISSMVAYSRARVKLELHPKSGNEHETIVSIDRSSEFKKWLNN